MNGSGLCGYSTHISAVIDIRKRVQAGKPIKGLRRLPVENTFMNTICIGRKNPALWGTEKGTYANL